MSKKSEIKVSENWEFDELADDSWDSNIEQDLTSEGGPNCDN